MDPSNLSIFDWIETGLIIFVAMAIIFVTREWSHNQMCLGICNGDNEKAEKLHDIFHKEGGI